MEKDLGNLFKLDGKVIVITGAAGLLGSKHAQAIAASGGIPILLDLNKNAVEKLASKIEEKFQLNGLAFEIDITNETAVKNNADELVERYGKIDGLVNNAAQNPKVEENNENNFSRLENFPLDAWMEDINVGLTGAFICAKYFGYKISKNPKGGSIVNISSDLGLIAPDQRLYHKENLSKDQQLVKPVSYSVIKTGLIGLTRYLATYWIDQGVRCNAICPGGVDNGQPKEFLTEVSSRIPMNRLANADEYQGTLVWMLSEASSYLNGAIVPVDGGRTVW